MRIKGFTSDGNGWLELNASRDAMTLKPIAKAQEVIIVIGAVSYTHLLKAGQKAPIKAQIKKFKKIELYY